MHVEVTTSSDSRCNRQQREGERPAFPKAYNESANAHAERHGQETGFLADGALDCHAFAADARGELSNVVLIVPGALLVQDGGEILLPDSARHSQSKVVHQSPAQVAQDSADSSDEDHDQGEPLDFLHELLVGGAGTEGVKGVSEEKESAGDSEAHNGKA